MNYTESQLEAINTTEGYVQVIATSGAGKSSCMVERTKNLISKGVKPEDICVISFTKESANDLKKKMKKLNIPAGIHVSTIHSLCYGILKDNNYPIQNTLPIYEVENEFNKLLKDTTVDVKDVMLYISYQKSNCVSPKDKQTGLYRFKQFEDEVYLKLYTAYEELLKKKHCMDFGDYLLEVYNILSKGKAKNFEPFKYLMMDEFQDSNLAQRRLLDLLCPSGNICVVGDVRQSIYGFQCATPEGFLNFGKEHKGTKVIHMSENFRSLPDIVKLSNEFIRPYFKDYKDHTDAIATREGETEFELYSNYSSLDEAITVVDKIQKLIDQGEKLSDIAVLYRNNQMSSMVEAVLKTREIDYTIAKSTSFFEATEIKFLINCLRLIINREDNEAWLSIAKSRFAKFKYISNQAIEDIKSVANRRNIGLLEASTKANVQQYQRQTFLSLYKVVESCALETKIEKIIRRLILELNVKGGIKEANANENEVEFKLNGLDSFATLGRQHNSISGFISYCLAPPKKKKKGLGKEEGVELLTIHGSKGREWKYVFVIGLSSKFPDEDSTTEELKEEGNLYYVGITRAKDRLYISTIDDGNEFYKVSKAVIEELKK